MAPQLLEYMIFIDFQHLVNVGSVQLLFDTMEQISDIIIRLSFTGDVMCDNDVNLTH